MALTELVFVGGLAVVQCVAWSTSLCCVLLPGLQELRSCCCCVCFLGAGSLNKKENKVSLKKKKEVARTIYFTFLCFFFFLTPASHVLYAPCVLYCFKIFVFFYWQHMCWFENWLMQCHLWAAISLIRWEERSDLCPFFHCHVVSEYPGLTVLHLSTLTKWHGTNLPEHVGVFFYLGPLSQMSTDLKG